MDGIRIDLRYALRGLLRERGFALVAVISLGLAIAANTTVFSVVNALLLRPLAVREPDGLLSIYRQREDQRWMSLSYPEFQDLSQRARSFSEVTAFTPPGIESSLRKPGEDAEAAPIALVTGNHFRVLGLTPLRGRFFTEADDRRGGDLPVVISERLWRGRFAADAGIIGSEVIVNGQSAQVVGVMPRDFTGTFTAIRTDIWLPLAAQPVILRGADSIDRREDAFLNVIGRLRPGSTREGAEAELRVLAQQLAQLHPRTDAESSFTITDTSGVPPFIREFIGGFLAILFGVVAAVLIVACSNLGGLLLARATTRGRELTVRAALGATRPRMIRQLLIESLLLAASGGLLGVVLAKLALAGLLAFVPNLGLPVNFDLSLDVRVLVFTAGVTTAAALLFGLLPALQASRPDLANVLREAAGLAGRKHARLRAAMLVAQVSISVVLLSGTVLLMRGLRSATDVDIGFDADRVALLSLDPTILGYDDARRSQLYRSLTDRVTALPATEMAGLAIYAPLGPRGDDARLVARAGADTVRIGYNAITPGFLSLLRIPIVRGRDFSSVSRNGAIVGERLAQRVWPGAEPLGQRFTVRGHEFEVVGVARDIKYRSVGEQPRLFAYFPLDRASDVRGGPIGVVLHARARANAAELAALLRRELSSIDPDVPAQSSLMTNGIQFSIFPAQLAGRVIGACGVLALVLVVVGLHALAAYTVAQRTRELGVRMAVGAGANDILRLVVGQSARLALAGLLLGLPIALLSAGLLRSLLYGVPPTDPITYILVLLLLGIAVVAATYLPARRALRVDPLTALRAW